MLLAIAIVALVGSVLGHIAFAVNEGKGGNDFIHIVAVMAWWSISLPFAIVWGSVSLLLIIIIAIGNS